MSRVISRRLIAKGTVQGVGFRASTLREAIRIGGLKGWVRILPNGDVEILVQGEQSKVDALVEWSAHGPTSAEVEKLEEKESEVDAGLGAFEIR